LPDAVGSIGVSFDWSSPRALLDAVYPRGPAKAAGLVPGDVVVALDGTSVSSLGAMNVYALLARREVGSTVKVTVQRGATQVTAAVHVASSSDGSDGAP
jgi:S1-C subfamily serine protease